MKIVLFGNFSGESDEGFTNISKMFRSHFEDKAELKCIDTKKSLHFSTQISIIKFQPDIIHYLTGPTIRSFIILLFYKIILFYKPSIAISATRPYLQDGHKWIVKILNPNIVFTQAIKWQDWFDNLKIKTLNLPNPVNLRKFKKLYIYKSKLRKKYKLPADKTLFLHVGHIKPNRNVSLFSKLQTELFQQNAQVVIVSSTFFNKSENIYKDLLKSGCIIIDEYLENISEVYNACDYYVFPVLNMHKDYSPASYEEVGVIDMPLSIEEALACELPVITTEIDAINELVKNIQDPPLFVFDGSVSNFLLVKDNLDITSLNYKDVKKRFDQQTVFTTVEKIYKEIVNT